MSAQQNSFSNDGSFMAQFMKQATEPAAGAADGAAEVTKKKKKRVTGEEEGQIHELWKWGRRGRRASLPICGGGP
jgi:hypothetical protein